MSHGRVNLSCTFALTITMHVTWQAIFIDPLSAAVPVIYLAAFIIYGLYVASFLSKFGAFEEPVEVKPR